MCADNLTFARTWFIRQCRGWRNELCEAADAMAPRRHCRACRRRMALTGTARVSAIVGTGLAGIQALRAADGLALE